MKTISVLLTVLAGTLMTPALLPAQEAGAGEKKCSCAMCAAMKAREAKMKAMEKKMDAEAAELQQLIDEMNASTGEKKLGAMAAVINRMAQSHKAMKREMAAMQQKGNASVEPKPATEPKAATAPADKPDPAEEAGKAEDPHAEHKH